ncbi:hypothetical protein Prudu_005695 [Prunus dulcis]|uniref:Uncharacterized protein n=1 Tax=Prunus dulcis TaxID=3755 RepID=A0A4Y1QY36_PRUDU|nr:hypothetical protein Prudu_005695 [Prunus dulcis]
MDRHFLGEKQNLSMEEFEKKVSLRDPMEEEEQEREKAGKCSSKTIDLLREFLGIQQRRAEAYAKLKRGFGEYMVSCSGAHGELAYQQVCSEVTLEFNECSKHVLRIESLFLNDPDYGRVDLAHLLRAVQTQEKQKLNLVHILRNTATIQVLKKAGRPSERLVSHENCRFKKPMEHECVHLHEITEAAGTEEAEADAQYDNDLKEAIRGVQDAVTAINEHLEELPLTRNAMEAIEVDFSSESSQETVPWNGSERG